MTDTVAGASPPGRHLDFVVPAATDWSPPSSGTGDAAAPPSEPADARHPLDPDPARSTKAAAVLALGVAAVVTGPVVGGIVPATVGLVLARQVQTDLVAGQGYLTGARHLRAGVVLAWIGIGLALAALLVASVLGIIGLADGGLQDFPDTSD